MAIIQDEIDKSDITLEVFAFLHQNDVPSTVSYC